MSKMKDILIDVPDKDLPFLAEMYKKHTDWAPFAFSLIETGIRWKTSEKYKNSIIFTSPNNSWKTDGTIIVLFKFFCNDVFVMTLDKSCKHIYEGLLKTKRVDYSKSVLFFLVHENFISATKRAIEDRKNLTITSEDVLLNYSTPIDIAKSRTVRCPPEVYLQKLEPFHASEINSVWPHRYPDSDKYISVLIEMNGGLGLFLKSTNELVAWIVVHCLGHLGILQTKDEYKRMGYGTLVSTAMRKELALRGYRSCGTIRSDNTASINLSVSVGSECIGKAAYINVEQNNALSDDPTLLKNKL